MPIPSAQETYSRRRFLARMAMAFSAMGAAVVGIPVLGAFLGPIFQKYRAAWRSVGPVDSFAVGQTVQVTFENAHPLPWAGVTAKTAAWLRRTSEGEFVAFAINCTHLGCPVRWLPDAELFMCPCHGGVYTSDGAVAAGPPPRPLFHHQVRVRNGEVEILTMPMPLA